MRSDSSCAAISDRELRMRTSSARAWASALMRSASARAWSTTCSAWESAVASTPANRFDSSS